MSLWPSSLAGRLLVAFSLGVVAVVVLALVVERLDDGPRPTKRAKPSHSRMGPTMSGVEVARPSKGPSPWSARGIDLRPTLGTVILATSQSTLAEDIQPVLEILPDGEVVFRRPEGAAPLSRDGHGVGVVLPAASLAALPPAARGALVGLLHQLLSERPVLPHKLCSSDLELVPSAVYRLLSWVP